MRAQSLKGERHLATSPREIALAQGTCALCGTVWDQNNFLSWLISVRINQPQPKIISGPFLTPSCKTVWGGMLERGQDLVSIAAGHGITGQINWIIEAVNFVQAHLSPHCLQPLEP